MSPYQKRLALIRSLIHDLSAGADLAGILLRHNLSPQRALRSINSRLGRREMKRLRDLACAQRSAILHGISPHAVNALASALHHPKPDPCIKSALNLLTLADSEPEPDPDDF